MRRLLPLLFFAIAFSVPLWGQADDLDDDAWLGSLLGVEDPIFGVVEEGLSWDLDTPKDSEEIEGWPAWSTDLSLTLGAGWKKNVLLSETVPLSSPFGQVEADFFALRSRGAGRLEVLALLYSEYRYYEDVPGMDDESLSMIQGSLDFELSDTFFLNAEFEGLYSEQVFDASEYEFEPEALSVSVWRPELGVGLEGDFAAIGTLGVALKGGEARYGREREDYDFVERSLDWSHVVRENHRIRVGLSMKEERYSERKERASEGVLEDASLLRIEVLQARGGWDWELHRGMLRSLGSKIVFETEDDGRGDYFERSRLQLREGLGLQFGKWEVECSLAFAAVDYRHRLRAVGAEETRSDRGWNWSMEATCPAGARGEWLIRVDGSDKKSNSAGLSYEESSVFLGWQFHGAGGA